MKKKPNFFDGAYRCTFTGKDPDTLTPLHYLECDGIILPDGSRPNPLAFYDALRGVWMRPLSRMFGFDFGSVPSRSQGIVSPIRWSRAFAFHDTSYITHGWWEAKHPNGPFVFKERTQHDVDEMLIVWMMADGCSRMEAEIAFEGVWLGGESYWDKHKGPFPCGEFLGLLLPNLDQVPH